MLVEFGKMLETAKLKLENYDPTKKRTAISNAEGECSVEGYRKRIVEQLGKRIRDLPKPVSDVLYDSEDFKKTVAAFAEEEGILGSRTTKKQIQIPEEYKGLTLNVDQTHQGMDMRFFLSTEEEYIVPVSGNVYLKTIGMAPEEAMRSARKVTPKYSPRTRAGVAEVVDQTTGRTLTTFNTYVPPHWKKVKTETEDKLPYLFRKLVWHLFPIEEEREYFFSWLYHSLFKRSFVYLVLCGPPGTGKNRLKLVLRALHGFTNTVDGKKSTFTDRFNSQLTDSTLIWFDELRTTHEMENGMKEVQNDSISIERKGIDASRSTQLFASFVISNNKPKDNYLDFDARKFAPLLITNKRLEETLRPDQINKLTNKVEKPDHPDYDVVFLAQIARWVKKHAERERWPNLEYRGPMFWRLAHTSMARWQKAAASIILETPEDSTGRVHFVKDKGFLWSAVEDAMTKKKGGRGNEILADYSTVAHFFGVFRDGRGKKVFETEYVRGSAMGDFYVRVVNKNAKILTEADVQESMGVGDGNKEESRSKESKKKISKQKGSSSSDNERESGGGKTKKQKRSVRARSGNYRAVKKLV